MGLKNRSQVCRLAMGDSGRIPSRGSLLTQVKVILWTLGTRQLE